MRHKRVLWWSVSLAALALVFASYLQRDFVFNLANQVWACF
ncbi:hypothetical protein [Ideonella sp. BN130291]|nr:hypothetical protein [Ideonella sp. BN130291]